MINICKIIYILFVIYIFKIIFGYYCKYKEFYNPYEEENIIPTDRNKCHKNAQTENNHTECRNIYSVHECLNEIIWNDNNNNNIFSIGLHDFLFEEKNAHLLDKIIDHLKSKNLNVNKNDLIRQQKTKQTNSELPNCKVYNFTFKDGCSIPTKKMTIYDSYEIDLLKNVTCKPEKN